MGKFISSKLRMITMGGVSIALLLTFLPSIANSTLMVTFDRQSDTSIRVAGTGTLDGPSLPSGITTFQDHIVYFDNVFASALPDFLNENVYSSSTLEIGSTPIDLAFTLGAAYNFYGSNTGGFYTPNSNYIDFSLGDELSNGFLDLSLANTSSPIFAAVGSTGDIYWSNYNVGSWRMTGSAAPVPEPSTFLLLGGGLAGLAFMVRRRKKD